MEQLKATPRWQDRRELVRQTDDAGALLAWLPHEKEGWVRAALATRLGQLGGSVSHSALARLSTDDASGLVQVAAAQALAQLGTPEAQQELQKLLEWADDLLVRQAAAQNQTAGSSEQSAAIETLLETLRHETIGHKRALALYQAGQRAGAQLLPTLHALWQTETEPLVRQELIGLLARLGGDAELALFVPALRQEPSMHVRISLVKALLTRRTAATQEVFLQALPQEPTEAVRFQLIHALNHWKDRRVLRVLYESINASRFPGTYPQIRQMLDNSLRTIPTAELVAWLDDEPWVGLCELFIKTLSGRGTEGRQVLLDQLTTQTRRELFRYLIPAVMTWQDEEVRELLYTLFDREARADRPRTPPVLDDAYNISIDYWFYLVRALGTFYQKWSFERLNAQLTTEPHAAIRDTLFDTLHQLRTPEAVAACFAALRREKTPYLIREYARRLFFKSPDTVLELLCERWLDEVDEVLQRELWRALLTLPAPREPVEEEVTEEIDAEIAEILRELPHEELTDL
ncbi:HEAT repeat domain-containing protein [Armatimonas rosea]|uniref:HEAT repeat protein n=1 Tax=Armatimonas rosea TaxID=685828 RepID=A0A7W9SUF0_ARMRO|nr:HEAT repeat domain-containing protein [Armatimonas rosea]MBB6052419.1 hypothetical protein [Armatimonas rosea]